VAEALLERLVEVEGADLELRVSRDIRE